MATKTTTKKQSKNRTEKGKLRRPRVLPSINALKPVVGVPGPGT